MIRQTRHTGLVVRDLNRSIRFYEALGLIVWKRDLETGHFIETVVGIPGVKLEWVKLKVSDESLVELLQYHSHPSNRPEKPSSPNSLGCSHISFTVDDAFATCALIEGMGGKVVNLPIQSPDGNVWVAYCHDIDGILIELVEEVH